MKIVNFEMGYCYICLVLLHIFTENMQSHVREGGLIKIIIQVNQVIII